MTTTTYTVDYLDPKHGQAAATAMFAFLAQQPDFCGGQLVPPSLDDPRWRVETWHEDATATAPDERLELRVS